MYENGKNMINIILECQANQFLVLKTQTYLDLKEL